MRYVCRKCKEECPESEFYIHSTSGKRRTYCVACIKATSKAQYHRNKDARNGAPDPRYAQMETKRHAAKVGRHTYEALQEAAVVRILELCSENTPRELRAAAKVLEQREKGG
jgi:hypothetical protein